MEIRDYEYYLELARENKLLFMEVLLTPTTILKVKLLKSGKYSSTLYTCNQPFINEPFNEEKK